MSCGQKKKKKSTTRQSYVPGDLVSGQATEQNWLGDTRKSQGQICCWWSHLHSQRQEEEGWAEPCQLTPLLGPLGVSLRKGSPQPEGLEGQKQWELTSCSGPKPGLSFVSGLSVSIFTSTTFCDVTTSVSITSSPSSWARWPTSTAKK